MKKNKLSAQPQQQQEKEMQHIVRVLSDEKMTRVFGIHLPAGFFTAHTNHVR